MRRNRDALELKRDQTSTAANAVAEVRSESSKKQKQDTTGRTERDKESRARDSDRHSWVPVLKCGKRQNEA
jgi:hypothetical protein